MIASKGMFANDIYKQTTSQGSETPAIYSEARGHSTYVAVKRIHGPFQRAHRLVFAFVCPRCEQAKHTQIHTGKGLGRINVLKKTINAQGAR